MMSSIDGLFNVEISTNKYWDVTFTDVVFYANSGYQQAFMTLNSLISWFSMTDCYISGLHPSSLSSLEMNLVYPSTAGVETYGFLHLESTSIVYFLIIDGCEFMH